MASEKTWSASPLSESQESAVESTSPAVSMCAALASSRSSSASPSHFCGAAGAPCLAIKLDQAGLGRVLVARTARNQHRAGDERQFVILLQEEDDAVLELDSLGLVRLELVQLGNGNLLPWLGLLGQLRCNRNRRELCFVATSEGQTDRNGCQNAESDLEFGSFERARL